jgi:hypothetical protein
MEHNICPKCNIYIANKLTGICTSCETDQVLALKQEANSKDNDLAYMGANKKVFREQRLHNFGKWYEELENSSNVISLDYNAGQGKVTINTEKFGIVDYFPKANKLLIRKDNDWNPSGLNWLKTHILK